MSVKRPVQFLVKNPLPRSLSQPGRGGGAPVDVGPERAALGFTSGLGFYRGDTQANTGASSFSINGDGHVVPTLLIARASWLTFDGNTLTRESNTAMEYEVEAEVATNYAGTGPIIVIGSGDARRFYSYLSSGEVAVYDRNNALVSIMGTANNPGGNNGVTRFLASSRARLRLVAFPDNTGYMEAIHPSGQSYRYQISGIPTGEIAVGWRQLTSGKITKLTANNLASGFASQFASEQQGGFFGPVLKDEIPIPDLAGGAPSGGFTATGISQITRGIYAGYWALGCDGRTVEGDGSPLAPAVVIVSPDFSTIHRVLTFGINASLQGVAVDTSGSEDTVWVAIPENAGAGGYVANVKLYDASYTNTGTTPNAAVEIAGDRINFFSDYAKSPNGLAYNPTNDSLFISPSGPGENTVREISADPLASPRLLSTQTILTDADHIWFNTARNQFLYSRGANGTNGDVYLHDIATNTSKIFYTGLNKAQAIEGIFVDKAANRLIVVNDGGFHPVANPALNLILRYAAVIA